MDKKDKFAILNNTVVIKKPKHLERLTKYEKARIVATRTQQIQRGSPSYVIVDGEMVPQENHDKNSYEQAMLEFKTRASPFLIKRPFPDGTAKTYAVQEMI